MTHQILNRLKNMWQGPPIVVTVGGKKQQWGAGAPAATINIPDPSLAWRLALRPSLGFGESYMKGEITIEGSLMAVLQGFHRSAGLTPPWLAKVRSIIAQAPVSVPQAIKNAEHHYNIGNDFYRLWLDPSQTYTCAYFPTGRETLEEAQFKKRELVCQKLRLESGQKMLDIGCGWGSLLFHAASRYGVKVTGITPAKEQANYIITEARRRNLSNQVTVLQRDWRHVRNTFDRVVSVGMFEQVRPYHYAHFFDLWRRLLSPNGVSVLHTITHRLHLSADPWIQRYIFPGGVMPTHALISRHAVRSGLTLYRSENLKPHYAKTLHEWARNFTTARQHVTKMFDEQFARMWWLYLQGSEAAFRWGNLELWQFELYGREAELPLSRDIETIE